MNENVQDIMTRLKNLVGVLALHAPLLLAATAIAGFGFGCTVELIKDDGEVINADFRDVE